MTPRLVTAYPEREIVALDPDERKLDAAKCGWALRVEGRDALAQVASRFLVNQSRMAAQQSFRDILGLQYSGASAS